MKGIDFLSPPDFEKKVLNSKTPSLVEFYADWSIPCQKVSKITNQLATKNLEEINIYRVDIDEHMSIPTEYGINSLPCLMLFEEGKIKGKINSINVTLNQLENFLFIENGIKATKKEEIKKDITSVKIKQAQSKKSEDPVPKATFHSTKSTKQKKESFMFGLIPFAILALVFFDERFSILFIVLLFASSYILKNVSSFKRCSWCDSNTVNLYFIEGKQGEPYWEYRNKDGTPDLRVADNFQKASFTSTYGCKKCKATTEFKHYVDKNPSQNVKIWRRKLIKEGDGIGEGFNWLDPNSETVETKGENRKGWG